MKKKDVIVIVVLLLLAGILFGGMKIYDSMNKKNEATGLVVHGNKILFYFDVDVDATYDFTGDYGHMHLEVKDGSFRVYDVECPNQICVNMGWVHKDDLFAQVGITCLPNNIAVIYDSGE